MGTHLHPPRSLCIAQTFRLSYDNDDIILLLYEISRSYFIPNLTAAAVICTAAPVVVGPTRSVPIYKSCTRACANRQGINELKSWIRVVSFFFLRRVKLYCLLCCGRTDGSEARLWGGGGGAIGVNAPGTKF